VRYEISTHKDQHMTAFRQWLADKLQRLAEILRGGVGGPGEE
jgi:hypothetical protein